MDIYDWRKKIDEMGRTDRAAHQPAREAAKAIGALKRENARAGLRAGPRAGVFDPRSRGQPRAACPTARCNTSTNGSST